MNELTISIPSTLRDIKLKDWQKFQGILEKNKDNENNEFLNLKMLQMFCGMDLNQIKDIPLSSFEGILEHLNDIFSVKNERINSFKLRGVDDVEVTFGLIPNLDEMTYGEYTDLESYIYDYKNAHRAMAVLYRPIQYKKGEAYHIQPYKGSEHLAEVMKDAPLDVYLGVQVFFYSLATKLGIYTMDSTLQQLEMNVEADLEKDSERNGEAIKQSIHLHRATLRSLMKLQESMSIQH